MTVSGVGVCSLSYDVMWHAPPAALVATLKSRCAMYLVACLCVILTLSPAAFTQTIEVHAKPITDADVALMRLDIQAQKEKIITDTMKLSASEAAAFWPIYKTYAAEQHAIAAKRFSLIIDYAQHLDKMSDDKARELTKRL